MASFNEIVGQEQIKEHLQGAIKQGKVSHAYIINGENRSGKEFIAKIFAEALLCENKGTDPCGECHSCRQAESMNHPDIIFVKHAHPSSVGIDDIRDGINNTVQIKPYSGPYKVYIVPETEKMTIQAQNALLKTLEEPPEYVVIILLSTSTDALLPTILSRCVTLNMKPVCDDDMRTFLMKEVKVTDYKILIRLDMMHYHFLRISMIWRLFRSWMH